MKSILRAGLFALILVSSNSCLTYKPAVYSGKDITLQAFYDELSPYGYWVHNREYGYVWIPHEGANFFPYASDGRWMLTQDGWTWFSDFTWGWAPFHYGRWDYDQYYGWFWFPGDEWAPAWVAWRYTDDYFGWAPLWPDSDFETREFYNDIYRWVFVRKENFMDRNINRHYISTRKRDEVFRRSRISERNVASSQGPDPNEIERLTGRRINSLAVSEIYSPGRRIAGDRLELYKPQVHSKVAGMRPAPQRISNLDEIKPVRERNRKERPGEIVLSDDTPNQTGQGSRETKSEKAENQREKDVRRQYEQKQNDRQGKQQTEPVNNQRVSDEERKRQQIEKDRSERKQVVEKQRRIMEKERKSDEATNDSSKTRTIENKQSRRRN
ncbi:MAG TPA: DUF6600 domain-containing protein [Bacteroidales bacterium]|nr:DUF6600 domain-containing protein [Bacteroidales bacterium]